MVGNKKVLTGCVATIFLSCIGLYYARSSRWVLQTVKIVGTFAFASYYQDHMVLQRGPQRANIWGYSPTIGDKVTVTVGSEHSVTATVVHGAVNHGGIWQAKLPAITQKGPFSIHAHSSKGTISIHDVLFGDVWLCSGQSNMEFSMSMVHNSAAELNAANHYPNIRVITVGNEQAATQQTDLMQIREKWSVASKASIGGGDWNYFSAVCWLYGKYLYEHRGYPIGLIDSDWGATRIEPWTSKDGLKACNVHVPNPLILQQRIPGKQFFPSDPTALWNSMIAPLARMTMFGAIWYQGESNSGHPEQYKCLFPSMIHDWREKFHQASGGETSNMFPFGFVQLAATEKNAGLGKFPRLRWAQTTDLGYTPNTVLKKVFMAVAADLPDFDSPFHSIHPRYKQDVAERLGLGAEAVAYNVHGIQFKGPFPTHVKGNPREGRINIEFDNGLTPIEIRQNNGFEVCCSTNPSAVCHESDQDWKPASIVNHHSSSIDIDYQTHCHSAHHVLGIRYAWRTSPCEFKKCAIYGKTSGLPMPPYKSLGIYT